MKTKRFKSSVILRAALLLLTVLTTTGAWAQTVTTVTDEGQLTRALSGGNGVYIRLANDIQLGSYLNMNGRERVTIDLNGHKLYRSLSSNSSDGHVIYSEATYDLTLISSVPGGSIEGGKANNGGAIYIQHGSKVTAENVIFQNNSAADHAGAIWNNGTFTATNCSFTNNTAYDVGAIYNSVTDDGAGTATLTNCTFSGNKGSMGAGALANAVGNTVMTINGGTITGNTGYSRGGGIWNGGTLNMQGKINVTGNKKTGDAASNVFLKSGTVITVTGSLEGSSIGVEMESTSGGTFTSGYPTYNTENPANLFSCDNASSLSVWPNESNEACLTNKSATYYDTSVASGPQMKTAANVASLTENAKSIGTTGKTTWYLASGTITNDNRIYVNGTVNIILEDGCSFTATKGICVQDANNLNIYAQSAGSGCGALIAKEKGYDASIGSNGGENTSSNGNIIATSGATAGIISIYGGSITAEGIGGGAGGNGDQDRGDLGGDGGDCRGINIYGGNVNATKRIGGGQRGNGIPYGWDDYYGDYEGVDGKNGNCQVTLSWTDPTDRIHTREYVGAVTLKKKFLDSNDNTYSIGTYNITDAIDGKWLEPFVEKYDITIEGGFEPACLEASKNRAPEGTEITLTAINGYLVSNLTAKDAGNNEVQLTDNGDGTWTFTMPASAVTVTPTVTRYYAVDFGSDVILNVSESDKLVHDGTTYCQSGTNITFSLNAPSISYVLQKVAIYYNNEEHELTPSGGTYSFVMPEADVNISPVWKIVACQITKQENMELSSADPENFLTENGVSYCKPGAEIAVTVNDIPEGRYVQNISILTEDGYIEDYSYNGDDTFIFIMPSTDVTLRVDFGVLPIDLTLLSGSNDFFVTKGISAENFTYFAGNEDRPSGCSHLFDGDLSKKWHFSKWSEFQRNERPLYVEFQTSRPVIPKHYILSTCTNSLDWPELNPSGWDIYAKEKSSDEWACIAHVENDQTLEGRNSTSYTFDFDNPNDNSYKYFLFIITGVNHMDLVQLSEMQMWVRNPAELADDADNDDVIHKWAFETTDVKLVDRTFYTDGSWNTLCLPFDIDNLEGTPMEGFTIKELDTKTAYDGHLTGFDNGTLYLNFKDAKNIKARRPYIMKKYIEESDARTITFTATNGSTGFNELSGYVSLVDGDKDTKWCTSDNRKTNGLWLCEFTAAYPVNVTGYEFTTANDTKKYKDRNPIVWTLKGRLNGSDEWTIIDSRDVNQNSEDAMPEENFASKSYDIASDKQGKYQYFRLEVTQVGNNILQLSELKLQGTYVGGNYTNPIFNDVTIYSGNPQPIVSSDGSVSFVGIYSPVSIGSNGDNTKLYLGADNLLYYPEAEMTIGSCRAYFQLGNDLVCGKPTSTDSGINNFVLNFGDEKTSIREMKEVNGVSDNNWYTIDGRRLNGMPTAKGIYINNGIKVVVK